MMEMEMSNLNIRQGNQTVRHIHLLRQGVAMHQTIRTVRLRIIILPIKVPYILKIHPDGIPRIIEVKLSKWVRWFARCERFQNLHML